MFDQDIWRTMVDIMCSQPPTVMAVITFMAKGYSSSNFNSQQEMGSALFHSMAIGATPNSSISAPRQRRYGT